MNILQALEQERVALVKQAQQITQAMRVLRSVKTLVNGVAPKMQATKIMWQQTSQGRQRLSDAQRAYWHKMSITERSREGTRRLRKSASKGRGLLVHHIQQGA